MSISLDTTTTLHPQNTIQKSIIHGDDNKAVLSYSEKLIFAGKLFCIFLADSLAKEPLQVSVKVPDVDLIYRRDGAVKRWPNVKLYEPGAQISAPTRAYDKVYDNCVPDPVIHCFLNI